MDAKRFTDEEVRAAIAAFQLGKKLKPETDLPGCTHKSSTCERRAKQLSPRCSNCQKI